MNINFDDCGDLDDLYLLCKINLAIAFVCVRSTVPGFHCHVTALRYKCEFSQTRLSVSLSPSNVFKILSTPLRPGVKI